MGATHVEKSTTNSRELNAVKDESIENSYKMYAALQILVVKHVNNDK